jgi:hypothetical protein
MGRIGPAGGRQHEGEGVAGDPLPSPASTEVAAGEVESPSAVVLPVRFAARGQELSLFSTIATFGTAVDVTLAELMIESFFPTDAATADLLRAWSDSG